MQVRDPKRTRTYLTVKLAGKGNKSSCCTVYDVTPAQVIEFIRKAAMELTERKTRRGNAT